jgi:hypothetical protein
MSKYSGSWVVSIKQNMNLTFNCPPHSYFFFFTKMFSLKVVHPLKICQNTKLHGPMFTGASVASISEV